MVVMAAASIQNTRILRFLIVLAAVIVTIFIYASYSTNPSIPPPLRMRSSEYAALHQQQQQQNILNAKNSSASTILQHAAVAAAALPAPGAATANIDVVASSVSGSVKGHLIKTLVDPKKLRHHYREPTIDKDAADAEAYAGDEAVIDATGANIGNGLDEVPDDIVLERLNHNELLDEQYEPIDGDIPDKANGTAAVGNIGTHTGLQESLPNERNINAIEEQQSPQNEVDNGSKQLQQQTRSLADDKNGLNKIPDSEVLIPTSNFQKFIENADKILKNMTALTDNNKATDKEVVAPLNENDEKKIIPEPAPPSNNGKSHKDISEMEGEGAGEVNNIAIIDDSQSEAMPPSSAIIALKRPNPPASHTSVKQAAAVPGGGPVKLPTSKQVEGSTKATSANNKNSSTSRLIYSSKGIPTDSIYERGHLTDEIDTERLCPNQGTDLRLLILITSAQDHMLARLAIRQTWGHYAMRRDVATAFVLGRTTNDTINKALTQENHIYGDLIRGNSIDSYNNLTLKTISSLEWVDSYCAQAKYVLKTDDDMFINVPKLLAFLDSHAKEKRVIFGRLAKKWKPVRNKKSKYYVSPEQFSAAVFPAFTTGPAYLLTGDIVHELYERSLQTVYLKLEDVFTTGIVSQQLGVRRLHANEFLNRRIAFNPCNIRKAISIHMIKANEQFDLWKKLLDQAAKCK